jgi:peptidoglycan/xylan/chitin deacetylase (PgdA/CDA1 family)
MSFRRQLRSLLIHSAALACADKIALYLQNRNSHLRGVVVEMHGTPRSLGTRFRNQLAWVSRHFEFSCLERFLAWLENPASARISKPLILFTFDDGRESNYHVAAPLLESVGARGVFFVVPNFAECSTDQACAFYQSQINPEYRPAGHVEEDWKPMHPAQIAELAARGHAIGNHTLTHAWLAGLSQEALEREIGESGHKLASWTGRPVEAFAWTFGWDSIDSNALRAIQRHHRVCFAACGGCIDSRRNTPELVWRREIEVEYSPPEYRFLYSGLADFWWSGRRRRLRRLLAASKNR